jgi:septal ring factor EnvC (AmiA/AmiB activator)
MTFPEIEAAAHALQKRIDITETEMAQMKDEIAAQKTLVRSWKKALSAFAPQSSAKKKRAERPSKSLTVS